ncbi:LacI family DNA-binding transcriptional regulator [Ruania sp. N2-46]|uniref:LacI family DNA-binding transcriptional regulator n=2 Tax=Occultella gossypii TaxID=2800820 RepID=A0ABS7S9Z2_9MICO|nr:LacI family DNA-binding transcriptional regulator [Occultella gossypii]
MRDVARRAGVSLKTVSNVVNAYPHVRPEMRDRVLRVIDELGYQMNFTARNLSLGRTGLIALAVPELRLAYFAELADAVIAAADQVGLTVLIEQTGGTRAGELEVLTSPRRRMTDGLLYSPTALRSADAGALDVDFPMVLLGERALRRGVDHVAMANEAGARTVTEHLLDGGRRRIALIGGHDSESGAGNLRARGFRAAMSAAGVEVDPRLVAGDERWSRQTGARAMAEILERGVTLDAVFALNDVMALGAMRELFERGLSVPGDVAVAGFDNIEEASFSRPSLTTIDPGRTEIARTAVGLLADRLAGRGGEHETASAHEIVAGFRIETRESTATD